MGLGLGLGLRLGLDPNPNPNPDPDQISMVSLYFETMPYRLDEATGYIDYDALEV